jgi:MFS family permease
MTGRLPNLRSHLTLSLCVLLHAFTHAYGSMLVPLYLLIVADLNLSGVRKASLIVTIYGAVYSLGSYVSGVMADRFDRKVLLAIGLLGNAAAIMGIGLSREYSVILALGVAAGVFGTLYHPAANALGTSHYPKSPAMAIGLLGMGAGLGFFFGPQFAGWRAHTAAWHFASVAQWQKPCVELGILGLFFGIIFLFFAVDPHQPHTRQNGPIDRALRRRVAQLALVLMLRDFAGMAGLSLAALYLERVFAMSVQKAGLYVGLMMLPSILFSPTLVYLTNGRRRLPALSIILICGGCIIATTPAWPVAFILPVLCVFQTLHLGSYAVSDSAMLERVSPQVRGRVVGIFLVIAGVGGDNPRACRRHTMARSG